MNIEAGAPETIVAIATAPGRGGVGIVRVSGFCAAGIAEAISGKTLVPRLATLTTFREANGAVIDQGLALWFPAPQSYTGEDVLELHAHGAPFALQSLASRCIALSDGQARLARPGEFTERAFLNGKLDLAQAEAVADMIDAGSRAATQAAANSLSGAFSQRIATLQAQLIRLRMFTEATLDFPEEDVDFLSAENAQGQGDAVLAALDQVLSQARQGQLLHDGIRIVLVGAPNVGKSSLLNRLAGDAVAIVTPVAGTTRDTIRARIAIDGLPCEIVDTAGLRATEDEVERIGISRTWAAIADAQLALILSDANESANVGACEIEARLPAALPRLRVFNKADTLMEIPAAQIGSVFVSALNGHGIADLTRSIAERVGFEGGVGGAFSARARHVAALERCRAHLSVALKQLSVPALELFAEELKNAHRALGEIVGQFSSDDLLGEIFGKFCIGK